MVSCVQCTCVALFRSLLPVISSVPSPYMLNRYSSLLCYLQRSMVVVSTAQSERPDCIKVKKRGAIVLLLHREEGHCISWGQVTRNPSVKLCLCTATKLLMLQTIWSTLRLTSPVVPKYRRQAW